MNGLTNEQVAENREKYGSNKLPEPKLKKWYHFAKDALCEKITMILIAIAMLQMMLGFLGVMELSEPLMIMFVLAIVTCIAVKTGLGVQKFAAELRAKTSIRYCDVIRNGQLQTINKDELVVGDVVSVGMGQEIFADGYLMEGKISVNNAAINGETKECKKTPIAGYVHKKNNIDRCLYKSELFVCRNNCDVRRRKNDCYRCWRKYSQWRHIGKNANTRGS